MRNSDWPFPTVAAPVNSAVKYVGLALGAFLVYKLVTRGVSGTIADVTRGVVGGAGDAAAGVVIGAGEAVGIPRTSEEACAEAIRAGRTWDASFACPAGTFLQYVTGRLPPPSPPPASPPQEPPTVWYGELPPDWAEGLRGLNRNC